MAARSPQVGATGEVSLYFEEPFLAIESSCDETSAAIVQGTTIRSSVVATQIEMHQKWGGVVPEAAARAHVEAILPVIQDALDGSSLSKADVRAVAVTNRPGLIGALSVGVSAAKALAFALNVPLIGIHHIEGHILSVLSVEPNLPFPHVSLVVSGGHTELVLVEALGFYRILGATRDDAAGEAFDKGARVMGLGYPGGKAIEEAARHGDPMAYPLPKGLAGNTMEFSFSGLKTAVGRLVQTEGSDLRVEDAAASLQATIVDVLVERAMRACEATGAGALTLVGGVAANEALRTRLHARCEQHGIRLIVPPISLCTDNAGMIGLAASFRLARGEAHGPDLDCFASCDLPTQARG